MTINFLCYTYKERSNLQIQVKTPGTDTPYIPIEYPYRDNQRISP